MDGAVCRLDLIHQPVLELNEVTASGDASRQVWPKENAMAKRMVAAHKLFTKHPGHDKHMCELVSKRQMDAVAGLSKGAKYLCHICGRAAASPGNLCEPVEI